MTSHEAVEAVPIQLTRMEGKFDLVIQRLDDLVPRVNRVEIVTAELEKTTQRLDLEAVARDEKAVALAYALKEAKEAQEAEVDKAWSPLQRLVLFGGAISTAVAIYQAITPR
jgi:hypothetical protein